MTKIFISDLHLGDGSKADDFHRDEELDKLFRKCLLNGYQVHLLGDILELWQAPLDKILWKHHKVCRWFTDWSLQQTVSCVYGNHDYLPFVKYWDEFYEDGLIFAQHGHQRDIFNKYKNPLFSLKWPIGKYISLWIGGLERWFHKDVDVWARKIKDKYGEFLWEAAGLQNKVNSFSWNFSDKKITIEGHTHQALLIKNLDGKIYANCGSWVDWFDAKPTYIQVNDNNVQLRDGLNYEIIKEIKI